MNVNENIRCRKNQHFLCLCVFIIIEIDQTNSVTRGTGTPKDRDEVKRREV